MANLKQRLHRKNAAGSYDVIYLETLASLVKMDDGTTLTSKISSMDTAINGKANASHTHSAEKILSGTFSATDIRAMNGTDYDTARIRNIRASTTDLTAGSSSLASGDVYFVYE